MGHNPRKLIRGPLAALTDEGALGVKSGRGLLGRYDEGQVRQVIEVRPRALLRLDSLARWRAPRTVRTNEFDLFLLGPDTWTAGSRRRMMVGGRFA